MSIVPPDVGSGLISWFVDRVVTLGMRPAVLRGRDPRPLLALDESDVDGLFQEVTVPELVDTPDLCPLLSVTAWGTSNRLVSVSWSDVPTAPLPLDGRVVGLFARAVYPAATPGTLRGFGLVAWQARGPDRWLEAPAFPPSHDDGRIWRSVRQSCEPFQHEKTAERSPRAV
jgi:hypothetical protein